MKHKNAAWPGIEPGTFSTLVRCSTNWTIKGDGLTQLQDYILKVLLDLYVFYIVSHGYQDKTKQTKKAQCLQWSAYVLILPIDFKRDPQI